MDVGDLVAHLRIRKDRSVDTALSDTEADAGRAGDNAGRRFGAGFGAQMGPGLRGAFGSAATIAANAGRTAGRAYAAGVLPSLDTIADRLVTIGKVGAIAGAVGGMFALAAATKPAAGALVALPAAAFVAGGAFAALRMGTQGVGDALSALAEGDAAKASEALAELSPNARSAVLAMNGVRASFEGVQQRVQGKLFAGLSTEISELGRAYLPILDVGLQGIAERMNLAGRAALQAARDTAVMSAVSNVLAGTGGVVGNLMGLVRNLAFSLLFVAQAGMPLLEQFTQWAAEGMGAAAAFLASAEGAAWLAQKIAEARVVLGLLGQLVMNVGALLGGLFTGAQGPGTSLLATLVALTGQAAAWATSMEGQQQITALFSLLSQVLAQMLPIIGLVAGAIMTLAGFLATLPAPVQTAVASFLAFSLIAGLALPKIVALVAGLRLVGGALLSAAAPMVMAAARWGLLGTAARGAALATNASLLSIVGAMARASVMMMARAAVMAASWLIAMGPIGWVVAAVIAAVALIIMNWDRVKAALVAVGQFFMALPGMVGAALSSLGSMIAAGATAAWNFLTSTASAAVSAAVGFVMGLPGMVAFALGFLAGLVYRGAMAAWRFLSETLPVVIAAALAWLAALPGRVLAFLTQLGAQIAAGARAAWNWLLTTTISVGSAVIAWVAALPGRIGSFIMRLPGILRNAATAAWNGFLTTTRSLAQSALTFIQSLPGRIRGFFSGAGQWLMQAGRNIIQGLWDGLKSMAQGVLNYIRDLGRRVADGFKAAVGIGSPSKIFASHGVDIGRGLMVGLDRIAPRVVSASQGLAGAASVAAAGNLGFRGTRGPAASSGANQSPALVGLVAELTAAVDAAREVADRPIQLDGAAVRRRLNTREGRERRLVTPFRG